MALAHIDASSPDAKTVTACSVEVSFLKGNDELEGSDDPDGPGGDPAIILRYKTKGLSEQNWQSFKALLMISWSRFLCNSRMFGLSRKVHPFLSG